MNKLYFSKFKKKYLYSWCIHICIVLFRWAPGEAVSILCQGRTDRQRCEDSHLLIERCCSKARYSIELVCGGLNLILQWSLFGESCLIYTCIMENRPINCSCMHFIATIHMAYWMLYPPPGITDRVWGGGRERCHLINFTLWIEVICL